MKRREEGFTLIELMVAVAIMAILSATCILTVGTSIARSRETATRANLVAMRDAIESYHLDHGTYPAFPPPLDQPAGYGSLLRDALVPNYLREIPQTMESGWHHPACNKVGLFWNQRGQADDEANGYGCGWRYDANPHNDGSNGTDNSFGTIRLLCTHKDLKGRSWTTY